MGKSGLGFPRRRSNNWRDPAPGHAPGRHSRRALETSSPPRFAKANRRDLSIMVAHKRCAGTTVSATLWLAQRAGLRPCVMATGGLGGVHRGAGTSFDISTDLDELSRADGSIVVCSGFKSILDLPASLEALETRGVAIIGYRTSELPAFTTIASGLPLEHRVESPAEAAAVARAHRQLGLPGAIVVANPVPAAEAVDREFMDSVLTTAIEEAERRQIRARRSPRSCSTPCARPPAEQSLRANRALLVANARLAAEIACDSMMNRLLVEHTGPDGSPGLPYALREC